MTTLQTNSARNDSSADLLIQRAQTSGPAAESAPGFDGVLEAFTKTEQEIEQTEELSDVDESSEDESSEAASDEDSEVSSEDSQSAPDGDEAGNTASNQESHDRRPIDQQSSSASSLQVHSADDLGLILTNAAQIDLADLAKSQLQGQQHTKPTAQQGTESTRTPEQPTSSQPKENTQHASSAARTNQSQYQGVNQFGSFDSFKDAAESAVKTAPTTPQHSAEPTSTAHVTTQAAAVQASQAVQAVVSDVATRNGQPKGNLNAQAAAVDASRAITGTESTSKPSSGQSGLDLGDRSQQSQSLSQMKAENDRPLMRRQVMGQVQRGLASIMNTKGGTMKMRLSPDHLGEIKIELTTKAGEVRVNIDAANDDARSMLKEGLEGLRHMMESRGVRIDELRVNDPQHSAFDQMLSSSDDHQSQADRDPQEHESDQGSSGGSNESELSSDESIDNDTPQSIWTQLGLDAIA